MDTAAFLDTERAAIIAAAEGLLGRVPVRHYESAGEPEVRRRLEALYERLLDGMRRRDLTPMIEYAQGVAEERFAAGYDLAEVQTAFNAVEEATWTRLLERLEPGDLAEALGSVSTVLGCGKDALARRYVSLAARAHVPSLDLRALFTGTEGR